MNEIRLKAMAKINLGLDVLRKREDGYHDLRMIMQTVRLHDQITLRKTNESGVKLSTNLGFLPTDNNNLAARAATILMDEFHLEEGVEINLRKAIPVAAGLAGGSSDAAAVLVGMNRLFKLGLNLEQLQKRGVTLGADIPFCLMRGTALSEGIGDVLTELPGPPQCYVVLAKPGIHVSTKFVYGNLKLDENTVHPDIDGQIRALEEGDLEKLASLMGNVLEDVTVPAYPVVESIRQEMLSGGAIGARMSGSGPTVFGLFTDKAKAEAVYEKLRRSGDVRQCFLTDFFYAAKR